MKKAIFILVSALFVLSCAKKKIPENDSLLGLDYYPTDQGKFVIYDVDSIVYNKLNMDTTQYKYRIKEKIADSFTDNEGKPAIRIERCIKMFNPNKSYDSIPWSVKEVWMLNADKKSIQISESNIRFTKLIFPIEKDASWDGNARNTIGEWDYTYDYIDKKETIGGNVLEKVLYVKQRYFPTAISHEDYHEKYAKGIGLVYRQIINITSQNVTPSKPNPLDRIEDGIIYKQTLVTYGHE